MATGQLSAYKSNPIDRYSHFEYVDWSSDIYSRFKGKVKREESEFYSWLITSYRLKRVLDLGVGGGEDLSGILEVLTEQGHVLERADGNDLIPHFIKQSTALFQNRKQKAVVHKGNWVDLPNADPPYNCQFDFAFLVGNSLTYIGGAAREYTQAMQKSVLAKFATVIEPGGYLFIDTRNYDYIRTFQDLPHDEILEKGGFSRSVCYHGVDKVKVLPAYISDSVVVLHYYDLENEKWGKLDFYPLTQDEMREALLDCFEIEAEYHDFQEKPFESSLFVQFLARRREQ